MADFLSAKRQELEQELVRQRESSESGRAHRFLVRQVTSHRNKLRRRQEKHARPDGSQVRPLGVLEYFMMRIGGCVMWLVLEIESSVDLKVCSLLALLGLAMHVGRWPRSLRGSQGVFVGRMTRTTVT